MIHSNTKIEIEINIKVLLYNYILIKYQNFKLRRQNCVNMFYLYDLFIKHISTLGI